MSAGKRKKTSFLERIGIKAKPVPTDEDVQRDKRYDTYKEIWKYLRDRIDVGVRHYFQTGSLEQLEQHVNRPALDSLGEHLEKLRAAGVVLVAPENRLEATRPRLRVISEQLSDKGKPQRFVIEERFADHSELKAMGNASKQATGKERVIHATVDIEGQQQYALASVIRVDEATLGD